MCAFSEGSYGGGHWKHRWVNMGALDSQVGEYGGWRHRWVHMGAREALEVKWQRRRRRQRTVAGMGDMGGTKCASFSITFSR